MILYLDTSALVKLVIDEPGTDRARALWEACSVRVTSRIAYPEARAALAARVRQSHVATGRSAAARRALDDTAARVDEVDVAEDVSRLAGAAAERYRLRGGDAIHLATAMLIGADELLFATWDRELSRAGTEAGLVVVPAG